MQIISEKKLAALSSGCKRSMGTYTREYTPLLEMNDAERFFFSKINKFTVTKFTKSHNGCQLYGC